MGRNRVPFPRRARKEAPVGVHEALPGTLRALGLLILCGIMAASGCTRRQLGLPRIELEVPSPDGQTVAYVRNHMGIDPPFQSLWIRTGDGKKTRLKRLGPDVDWCNTIVWSADGSRAGFLVQDARLIVAEVGAREVVLEEWLVPAPRHYPTREVVRELALSDDGKVATYRLCSRRRAGCEPSREFALP